MTSYRLRFPHDLDADLVTLLLAGLSATLASPQLSRHPPSLLLIATGRSGQLEHHLEALHTDDERILTTLRSVIPAIRLDEVEDAPTDRLPTAAIELRLTTSHRPLRTDRAATISAALLGALASAGTSERLELRWLITGSATPAPARRYRPDQQRLPPWLAPRPATWHQEAEAVQREKQKQAEPLLQAVVRVGVWTSNQGRARQLITRTLRALGAVQAPGVRLVIRSLPQWLTRRRFHGNAIPWLDWPLLLNAAELASLVAWPIDSPQVPGLVLGATRQLPPARNLASRARDGVVVADTTFPGSKRQLVLRDRDRLLHTHVLGPTGSGKSVLLGHFGASDLNHGHGLIAVDPRGDFVDYLADHVPESRRDDVIVFDPADSQPIGFNPLQASQRPDHLIVDHLDHIFGRLFGGNYGPRSGDINRAGLLTLLSASRAGEQYTLAELPLLLTNPIFRRQLTGRLKDPTLQQFWAWYDQLGNAQATIAGPLLNKYRKLLLAEPVKNVIGQADPGWSLDDVIQRRRILLVRLSAGEIGEESAQLLGSLLVAAVWMTAQARTRLPAEQRRPVMLIIDEFQNYLRLPTSLGDMLAQARGLGLGLTLANQQLGQLSSDMEAEVLANARSRIVFQTNARDARTLAPHLPGVTPEDLQHLGAFEVIAQLAVGSNLAPPASGQTRAPEDGLGVIADLKDHGRRRFGTPVEEIRKELAERWQTTSPSPEWVIGEVDLDEIDVEPDDEGRSV